MFRECLKQNKFNDKQASIVKMILFFCIISIHDDVVKTFMHKQNSSTLHNMLTSDLFSQIVYSQTAINTILHINTLPFVIPTSMMHEC